MSEYMRREMGAKQSSSGVGIGVKRWRSSCNDELGWDQIADEDIVPHLGACRGNIRSFRQIQLVMILANIDCRLTDVMDGQREPHSHCSTASPEIRYRASLQC